MITNLNRLIGDILTSNAIHRVLVEPAIRKGFLKTGSGLLCVKGQAPYLQSLIYWKIYERSEVRLIKKFLKNDIPVIEFGASLGMTSSAICSTVNKGIQVISVEANPKLFNNLNETRTRNSFDNLTLICAAVDYSGAEKVSFMLDESNLGSHKGISNESVMIPAIRLGDIITKNQLHEFSLVCDIEGAELEMFINESNPKVIDGCKQIIIELHTAVYKGRAYLRSDINEIIQEKFRMRTVFTDGKTWVYEKMELV